jgi:hypothetical protein
MNEFLRGSVIGIIFTAFCVNYMPFSDVYQHRKEMKKIEICQEKLPRNEKCVLIAVPEKKDAK